MVRNKLIKYFFTLLAILVVFGSGIYYGAKRFPLPLSISYEVINKNLGKPADVDFSLFWDAWRLVEENHLEKPDRLKMLYGAISGMVKSIDDPYTVFFNPTETRKFSSDLNGVFEGIGAEIGVKKGMLTIIAPLVNSPAERAGIRAGDKILKIDDALTGELTIDEAVNLIRGPKGTAVTLTIMRGTEEKSREIKIIRETIVVKSVEWRIESEDLPAGKEKIAIIKISRFAEDTSSEINAAANEILKSDVKGIILDLRNNPGGYLESAVDVASIFMPANKLVVTEKFQDGKKKEYLTRGGDKLSGLPAVVLTNEGSASAAEILAGSLRDIRQIKLVGEKTFGKGSVQELKNMKNNSSIKITIAEWLTPAGKNINKEGLKPDIEIGLTDQDLEAKKDPQLDEAIKLLRQL